MQKSGILPHSKKRLHRFLSYLLTFLVPLILVLSSAYWQPIQANTAIQTPLTTRGNQIIDKSGKSVLLRGVNWFGMETDVRVPHGLWVRDYKEMLAQIKGLGYNVIRLPYSVQSLKSNSIGGVDFNIGSNRDLQGKTPLQVLDTIVQEAQRQGLLILLDSHRLNESSIPELWYGDGFTEQDWIDTWVMLARRYQNQANIIGADLKNEPHGQASWGTGDRATDWRLAAERCGNAILAVNPKWLIIVEGVEKNVPGQKLPGHWWGGNLEGVKRFPVRLSQPKQVVYSPHEYGTSVANVPWFSDPTFPKNLRQRWQIGFQYIADENIAPVWIGEFGGQQVDTQSKEGIWQRMLVDFIREKNLHFTYWSWNPNSGDTKGILLDDWRNIDRPKQTLLSTLLGNATVVTPNPTPSPTPNPTPSPTPTTPTSNTGLRAEAIVHSDWEKGFCVNFRITNPNNTPSPEWQLQFVMNQANLKNPWNGTFNRQGTRYTVIPPDWARRVAPNQTVEMGFCADKTGTDYQPRQVQAVRI